ncbi:hypothetical protein, partial [Amaricoccus sp.]|uniref:hypothetical protein n=1 Tax=Amaricoccus sp. TaxID=1872485 RepID=UPI002CB770FD
MTDAPLAAYDYVVDEKPALERVMEQQVAKTDKAGDIANGVNAYASERMRKPADPLELLQRMIAVSLETVKIFRGLQNLDLPCQPALKRDPLSALKRDPS